LLKLEMKEKFQKRRTLIGLLAVFIIFVLSLTISKNDAIKEQYNKLFHEPSKLVNIKKIREDFYIQNSIDMKILRRETNLDKGTDVVYVEHEFNSNLMSISGTIAYYYKYSFLDEQWYYDKSKEQKDFTLNYDISGVWEGTNKEGNIVNISIGPMNKSNEFDGTAQVELGVGSLDTNSGYDDLEKFTVNDYNSVYVDWGKFRLSGFNYYVEGDTYLCIPYEKDADYLVFGYDDFKLKRKLTSD